MVLSVAIVTFNSRIIPLCVTKCTPTRCCRFGRNDPCPGNYGSIISTMFNLSTTGTLVRLTPCLHQCRCPVAVPSLVFPRDFATNLYVNPGHVVKNLSVIACNNVFSQDILLLNGDNHTELLLIVFDGHC